MTALIIAIFCMIVWFAAFCWIVCWNIERNEPPWIVLVIAALWPILGLAVLARWAWRKAARP